MTVEASKKLVPAQKACSAVPPRSALMIGKAAGRLVESIATADTMVSSDIIAKRKRRVGFHSSAAPGSVTASAFGIAEGVDIWTATLPGWLT